MSTLRAVAGGAGRPTQHGVAGRVAERVVDRLELVQVGHDDRGRAQAALGAGDRGVDGGLDGAPVAQAGERVAGGGPGEDRGHPAQLEQRHHLGGDVAQQAQLHRVERARAVVEGADGADGVAVAGEQRRRRVEPDAGGAPGDERVVGEQRLGAGVGGVDDLGAEHRVLAHRVAAAAPRPARVPCAAACHCRSASIRLIDGRGRAADVRGQPGGGVQVGLRGWSSTPYAAQRCALRSGSSSGTGQPGTAPDRAGPAGSSTGAVMAVLRQGSHPAASARRVAHLQPAARDDRAVEPPAEVAGLPGAAHAGRGRCCSRGSRRTTRTEPLAAAAQLRRGGVDPALAAAALTQARLRSAGADQARSGGRPDVVHPRRAGAGHPPGGRGRPRPAVRAVSAPGAWWTCAAGSAATWCRWPGLAPAALGVDRDPLTAEVAVGQCRRGRGGRPGRGALRGRHGDRPRRGRRRVRRPGAAQQRRAGRWTRARGRRRSRSCSSWPAGCRRPGRSWRPASRTACCRLDAEAEWVSDGGDVVECALWCGPLATAGVRRRATLLPSGATLTGDGTRTGAVGPVGRYLAGARRRGDPGRTGRRGRPTWSTGRLLDPTIAYLTCDRPARDAVRHGVRGDARSCRSASSGCATCCATAAWAG